MQPLEFMSLSLRRRQSIWVFSWWVFYPKRKKTKVINIIMKIIKTVTGDREMIT